MKNETGKLTPAELADILECVVNHLRFGCGNHGCIINPPKGMGTNSTCQCRPALFRDALLNLASMCEETGREWRQAQGQ